MKGTILTILLVLLFIPAWSQVERKEIRSGNSAYEKGNYQKAEIDYRRALERNPNSLQAKYNMGNALYKLNNSPEAEKIITPLVDSIINPDIKSNAYHNIGNFNLAQKKYQESIDFYKNSLRIHPNDMETKSNLAYAQKMLKDKKDKQNKDKNKDKNKDNKDKNKDQKQDQKDQKNNNDKKDGQQPPPKITPQAAQQMLQAIQNKEKETQDKVNKEKAKVLETRQRDKNW